MTAMCLQKSVLDTDFKQSNERCIIYSGLCMNPSSGKSRAQSFVEQAYDDTRKLLSDDFSTEILSNPSLEQIINLLDDGKVLHGINFFNN